MNSLYPMVFFTVVNKKWKDDKSFSKITTSKFVDFEYSLFLTLSDVFSHPKQTQIYE